MTLLYILFFIWVLFILFDFKKAVLCYAPFKILFYYDVRLTAALPFDMAIILLIAFCFFVKRKEYSKLHFPFTRGYVVYAIIYSIGCIIPVFMINRIPSTVISILLYSYIYFQCLRNMRDVKLAAAVYMLFSLFLVGNGMLELFMHKCPVDDWIRSMPFIDKEHAWDTDFDELRFGLPRIKSFMPFSITYGVACAILLSLPFYLVFENFRKSLLMRLLVPMSLVLLLIGVITSASRSPILGIVVLLSYLFLDKELFKRYKTKILLLLLLIAVFMWPFIYDNIMSILNPNAADAIGGSSMDMRIGQYSIAFDYMMQSPLFGLGKETQITDILFFGGESIWLPLMINNGILGVFGYIFLYYAIVKNTKVSGSRYLHIVTASWLVMNTATSLMGLGDATYLTLYMLLYRYIYLKSVVC